MSKKTIIKTEVKLKKPNDNKDIFDKIKCYVGESKMPIEINTLSNNKFNRVKEVLTRIGIDDGSKSEIKQIVHVLHKKGKYYLVHFKHMFLFDGKFQDTKLTYSDITKLKYVTQMLRKWGLVETKGKVWYNNNDKCIKDIVVLKQEEVKNGWKTKSNYNFKFKNK